MRRLLFEASHGVLNMAEASDGVLNMAVRGIPRHCGQQPLG